MQLSWELLDSAVYIILFIQGLFVNGIFLYVKIRFEMPHYSIAIDVHCFRCEALYFLVKAWLIILSFFHKMISLTCRYIILYPLFITKSFIEIVIIIIAGYDCIPRFYLNNKNILQYVVLLYAVRLVKDLKHTRYLLQLIVQSIKLVTTNLTCPMCCMHVLD